MKGGHVKEAKEKYEQVCNGKRFPEHLLLAVHTGLAHEKRDCSKKEHDFNQLSQHFSMLKKVCFGGQCPVSKPFDSGKGEKKKKNFSPFTLYLKQL